jgi:hypothetical protein
VIEQKLGTTPKAMRETIGGMPRSCIALETGMHSPWVSRWKALALKSPAANQGVLLQFNAN